MSLVLLFLYTLSQFLLGMIVFRKICSASQIFFHVIGALLLGVYISIPITYAFSCLFSLIAKEPMIWGMTATITLVIVAGIKYKVSLLRPDARRGYGGLVSITYAYLKNEYKGFLSRAHCHLSDFFLLLFSLVFSFWVMGKTFRVDDIGQLIVGSNNVFDFGLFIGLVRSMSWGENIPFMSPFIAGLPFFYHFLFAFWVSLWEYCGIGIYYAVNILSIFSFTALLVCVYYFPQIVLKKGKLVGWIAVFLTVTHSTMTFWHLLFQKGFTMHFIKDIWLLPTYPFAGPFDGSTISIFTTLNNYVNQRHLAFSVAVGLLLYMIVVKYVERKQCSKRLSFFIGCLIGLMILWNMAVFLIVGATIVLLIAFQKQWRLLLYVFLGSVFSICLSSVQYISHIGLTFSLIGRIATGTFGTYVLPAWTTYQYLWENLTLLPLVVFIGYFVTSPLRRRYIFPFLVLFILECLFVGFGKRGFDQKYYSFLIIGVNVIAATGIVWMWEKRSIFLKCTACILFFTIIISGCVDLMAIKNEFAFPFVRADMLSVLSWIQKSTPKDAVFVSYADIIDPVVLAGRKNFFGFYGNIGWTDRSINVRNIFGGDVADAKKQHISYILAPRFHKNDFPYIVDTTYFQEHKMMIYEDEKYQIFEIANDVLKK